MQSDIRLTVLACHFANRAASPRLRWNRGLVDVPAGATVHTAGRSTGQGGTMEDALIEALRKEVEGLRISVHFSNDLSPFLLREKLRDVQDAMDKATDLRVQLTVALDRARADADVAGDLARASRNPTDQREHHLRLREVQRLRTALRILDVQAQSIDRTGLNIRTFMRLMSDDLRNFR